MKTKWIIYSFFFLLIFTSKGIGRTREFEWNWINMLKKFHDCEKKVNENINSFNKYGNGKILWKAYKQVLSLRYKTVGKNHEKMNEVNDKFIRLKLKILKKAYNARDHSYNLNNVNYTTKVPPPYVKGQIVFAGMDPKGIKDPIARKKYEADIATNNRRNAEYRRERELQLTIDKIIRFMEISIKNLYSDKKSKNRILDIINNTIQDEKLRKKLLRKTIYKNDKKKN